MIMKLGGHFHHDALFELVDSSELEKRIKDIKLFKPLNEQPLRLKLITLVPDDKIPGIDSPEWLVSKQTKQVSLQAWRASEQTWQAYITKYAVELKALHKELCPDCPWDGNTIFTRKDKDGQWF